MVSTINTTSTIAFCVIPPLPAWSLVLFYFPAAFVFISIFLSSWLQTIWVKRLDSYKKKKKKKIKISCDQPFTRRSTLCSEESRLVSWGYVKYMKCTECRWRVVHFFRLTQMSRLFFIKLLEKKYTRKQDTIIRSGLGNAYKAKKINQRIIRITNYVKNQQKFVHEIRKKKGNKYQPRTKT